MLLAAALAAFAPVAHAERESCDAPAVAARELGAEARRRALSEAYAQLHDAASGMRLLDEFLIVKLESEATGRAVRRLADYAARLRRELQTLAKAAGWISLEDDGLPLLARRADEAQERDQLRTLAPVIGAAGADFERTLLLSYAGSLNRLRFLAQALADAEDSAARCRWARGVQQELDRHYVAIVALLDRRFFRKPADTPLGAAGETRKMNDEEP